MSTVLITGCSSGFGHAAALSFARRGYRVYASMRDTDRGAALAQRAEADQLDIHIRRLDVTEPGSFTACINTIIDEAASIDVLVNNAGILCPGAWEDLTEASARAVMETNFFGPMLLARAVLPHMRRQQRGYIIMLSSLSGIAGLAGDVAYSASKFALEGASEALRHEVDRWGIHVALVLAGSYATGLLDPRQGLPVDYPPDSPYRQLVESKLRSSAQGLDSALPASIIGDLLPTIAESDGSQLRWPADDLARTVLTSMHGQGDAERDQFLRGAGGSDWWSDGADAPATSRN